MSVDCASMTLGTTGEALVETPLKRGLKRRLEPWLKRGLEALVEASVEPRAEARVEALGEAPVEARAEARVEARVEEPAETPVNVPQSLGVVGYAAFALLLPVPLGEIVPFPLVVTAFEAEASRQVLEPASEPEDVVADFTAPAPEQAVSYAVGGYRPAPGPQMWGRELPEPASAPDCASHEVEAPVDDSVLPEMAAPGELDRVALKVTAVPVDGSFYIGGYAADRASADRQARAVLDELSFLFDGTDSP
jgi:hypothetical protein